jgi:hypothetical protein
MSNEKQYPTKDDCKPGLWVKLNNGWIVGPIVETGFTGTYVKFGDGTWQVQVMGIGVPENSPRLVVEIW